MSQTSSILGIQLMKDRLKKSSQQDRMIADKLRSLKSATYNSYQGALITKLGETKQDRALINPDVTKQSYDDKIVSVDFSYGYSVGDIFTWDNTNTMWLIYLQDLTELAYFKGHIRKCNYELQWKDSDGNIQSTYASIQGPLANQIDSIMINNNANMDKPNYNITILMPKTTDTIKYFKRYTKFYIQGLEEDICWRVTGADYMSMDNIIKFTAQEYYANKDEDNIEEGIAGDLIVNPFTTDTSIYIEGPDTIKPYEWAEYTYRYEFEDRWSYDTTAPIDFEEITYRKVRVKWNKSYGGSFTITCGATTKTIKVVSLFE